MDHLFRFRRTLRSYGCLESAVRYDNWTCLRIKSIAQKPKESAEPDAFSESVTGRGTAQHKNDHEIEDLSDFSTVCISLSVSLEDK